MPLNGAQKTAQRNAMKAALPVVWTDARLDRIEGRWPMEWDSLKTLARWVTGRK